MKKFLVVLLALVMVFGLATSAFAADTQIAEFNDIASQSQAMQNAIQRLAVLGVLEGNDGLGGAFRPAETLTRAEFAKIVVMLSGDGDEALAEGYKTSNSRFTDVTPGNWYTGWVIIASENGLFQGFPDGTFRPNAEVTMQEISAVLLRLAGYNDHLGGNGNGNTGVWPHNYNNKARNVGLLDDVASYSGSAAATRGDMAIMANSVLEINMVTYVSDSTMANLAIIQGNGDQDWFVEEFFNTNEGDYRNANILYKGFEAVASTVRFAEAEGRDYDEISAWGYADFNDSDYELYLAARKTDKKDYDSWIKDERTMAVASNYFIAGDHTFADLSNMIAKVTYKDNSKREVLFIEVTSTVEYAKEVYRDSSTRMSVDGRSVGLSSEVTYTNRSSMTSNSDVTSSNFKDLTLSLAGDGVRPYADAEEVRVKTGSGSTTTIDIAGTDDDNDVPAKIYFDEEGRAYAFKNYEAFDRVDVIYNTADKKFEYDDADYISFGIFDKIQSGLVEYKNDVDKDFEDIESEKSNYIIIRDGSYVKASSLQENDVVYYLGNSTGVHTYLAYGPSEGELTKQANAKLTISGFAYPYVNENVYYSEDGEDFDQATWSLKEGELLDENDFGEVEFAPAYNFGKIAYLIGAEAGTKYVGVVTRIEYSNSWSTSNLNNYEFEGITILNAEGQRVTYKFEKDFMDDYNDWYNNNAWNGGFDSGYLGDEEDVKDFVSATNVRNPLTNENKYTAGFQVGMIVELRINSNDEITKVVRASALNPYTGGKSTAETRVEVNRNSNRLTVPNYVYSKATTTSGSRYLYLKDDVVIYQVSLKDNYDYDKAEVVSLSSLLSSNFDSTQVVDFKVSGSEVTHLYVVKEGSSRKFDFVYNQDSVGSRRYRLLSDGEWHKASNLLSIGGETTNQAFITYQLNSSDEIASVTPYFTAKNWANWLADATGTQGALYNELYSIEDSYNVVVGYVYNVSSNAAISNATLTVVGQQYAGGNLVPYRENIALHDLKLTSNSRAYDFDTANGDNDPITGNVSSNFSEQRVIAVVDNNEILFIATYEKDTVGTANHYANVGGGGATAPDGTNAAMLLRDTLLAAPFSLASGDVSISGNTVRVRNGFTLAANLDLGTAVLNLDGDTLVLGGFELKIANANSVTNGSIDRVTSGGTIEGYEPSGYTEAAVEGWTIANGVWTPTVALDSAVATALNTALTTATRGNAVADASDLTGKSVILTGDIELQANLALGTGETLNLNGKTVDLNGNTLAVASLLVGTEGTITNVNATGSGFVGTLPNDTVTGAGVTKYDIKNGVWTATVEAQGAALTLFQALPASSGRAVDQTDGDGMTITVTGTVTRNSALTIGAGVIFDLQGNTIVLNASGANLTQADAEGTNGTSPVGGIINGFVDNAEGATITLSGAAPTSESNEDTDLWQINSYGVWDEIVR